MRHARPEDLDRLEGLLERLRALGGLKEKRHGVFYRGSRAFLHFHEDAGALYADVRLDAAFERLRVDDAQGAQTLVARVRRALS